MNREPLKNGTILRFPDGQECEIVRLLGGGGSALLYEVKILGSELYAAVKEIFPACGYIRKDGQIISRSRLPRKEKELQRRKSALIEQETLLSQKASRTNYHVLFLQPPVWNQADLRLPDGTVFSNVENTYARMDSLAEKGASLAQLIGSGGRSLDETLRIMEAVLDAYAALHEDGFLHGDCQMSNLFLLKAGQGGKGPGTACIIDFGSARELGEDGLTAPITDEIFSTDGYCAPELMFPRGDELRLSAAADVWSLGFLLLNLLADRGLDEINGITEYLMLHPEEKVLTPDESAILGCTPAQRNLLNVILNRALANDPKDRFSDAGVMRDYLHRLIRCRCKDPSGGLDSYLLWDAAWRYRQANPSLFQTEHRSRLTDVLASRRLNVNGRYPGGKPVPAGWLLQELAQKRENAYLYGAGGAGKSFAVAPLIARWMESGERIPLYLDLSSFTAEVLDNCGRDGNRVIPALLARQYFGQTDLGEELDALLRFTTPYTLVLDNLHKVEKSVLPTAIAVLNDMKERWPEVWVLVQGRTENPGSENQRDRTPSASAYDGPSGNQLTEWRRMWKSIKDDSDEIYDPFEPMGSLGLTDSYNKENSRKLKQRFAAEQSANRALKLHQVELLPLTTEEILAQVQTVRREGIDFAAGSTLLKQEQILRLPLFLMRYLELLSLGRDNDTLPNGAMELLHGYFALQEYHGGRQELHDLLREQMPWIASQYGRFQRTANPSNQIAAWLRERYGSDADIDGFFRRSVEELAVLECGCQDDYYFVHDCYQEYFAALFAANCIRQAIACKSAEPMKVVSWEWSEELTARCLELCCLTVRDEQVVCTRSETEVLGELGRVLVKLRRRDLRPLSNLTMVILRHRIISPQVKADDPDGELVRLWTKIYQKSLSGLPRLVVSLSEIPARLLFLGKNNIGLQLRALGSFTENGSAEYELACRYQHGKGVRANPKQAEKYLLRAVEKGYPPALNAKGELAEQKARYKDALYLYQQAADKLYPPSMWHLGGLHLQGYGVPRNQIKAFELFLQAAKSGFAPAQYDIGQMLEQGLFQGTYAKALRWYDKAAAQGFTPAKDAALRLRTAQSNKST